MAKNSSSPLVIAAFQPVKVAKKPAKVAVHGENAVIATPHTQVGEKAAADAGPTPMQRLKMDAKDAKHSATREWVRGRMSTKEHSEIHSRADHVIRNGTRRMPDKGRLKKGGPYL